MEEYVEPARTLPVRENCDVLVIGGGTAGVVAALASARTGAKTVLLEQNGYLGGTIHGGVCGVHSYFNHYQMGNLPRTQIVRGIPGEIADRMMQKGACPGHIDQEIGYEHFPVVTVFDREQYKLLALEMLEESGAKLLLHCFFSDVIRDEKKKLVGVIAEGKGGRFAIFAKCLVDATGDADVAFSAGCEMVKDIEPYDTGLLFAMANVDIPVLEEYLRKHGLLEILAYEKKSGEGGEKERGNCIRLGTKFTERTWRKEDARWISRLRQHHIWGLYCSSCHENELTYINGCSGAPLEELTPEEMTKAERENGKSVRVMADALRELFPGFERAYISWISPFVGVRRSRVVQCRHMLTSEEIENAVRFTDEIGVYGFHDLAPIHHVKNGAWYGIPYGALLPVNVCGILVAGRMITPEKTAHMSTRNSACCMVQGQAAGTAAAMSALRGIAPEDLPAEELRRKLRGDGVFLD